MITRRMLMTAIFGGLLIPHAIIAQSRPQQKVADPSGKYVLEFELHGGQQTSELVIVKKGDRLTGTITAHEETVSLNSISFVDGQLNATVTMSHGEIALVLTFESSDKLAGTFSHDGGVGGKITGRRK